MPDRPLSGKPDNKGEDRRSRFATNGLRRLRKSRENSELTPAVVLALGQGVGGGGAHRT
jgi:hypothetical protein